jgi:hypothetical protein
MIGMLRTRDLMISSWGCLYIALFYEHHCQLGMRGFAGIPVISPRSNKQAGSPAKIYLSQLASRASLQHDHSDCLSHSLSSRVSSISTTSSPSIQSLVAHAYTSTRPAYACYRQYGVGRTRASPRRRQLIGRGQLYGYRATHAHTRISVLVQLTFALHR